MKYSYQIIDHFFNPRNVGVFGMEEKNIFTGEQGSYNTGTLVQLQLKIEQDIISQALFKAYGGCALIATCSYVTQWLTGRKVSHALELTSDLLMTELELPATMAHCALLVEDTVKNAIGTK